ncbi:MAG: hypothetical protein WCY05_03840, partial [Candidatus Omnitrophota bacterium]
DRKTYHKFTLRAQGLIDFYNQQLKQGAIQIINTGDRLEDATNWWIKRLDPEARQRVVVLSTSSLRAHRFDENGKPQVIFDTTDLITKQQRQHWQEFYGEWLSIVQAAAEIYFGRLKTTFGTGKTFIYEHGKIEDRDTAITICVMGELLDITAREVTQMNRKLRRTGLSVKAGDNRRGAMMEYLKKAFDAAKFKQYGFDPRIITILQRAADLTPVPTHKGKGLLKLKNERVIEEIFDMKIDWSKEVELHGDGFAKSNDRRMAQSLPGTPGVSVGAESQSDLPSNIFAYQGKTQATQKGPKALLEHYQSRLDSGLSQEGVRGRISSSAVSASRRTNLYAVGITAIAATYLTRTAYISILDSGIKTGFIGFMATHYILTGMVFAGLLATIIITVIILFTRKVKKQDVKDIAQHEEVAADKPAESAEPVKADNDVAETDKPETVVEEATVTGKQDDADKSEEKAKEPSEEAKEEQAETTLATEKRDAKSIIREKLANPGNVLRKALDRLDFNAWINPRGETPAKGDPHGIGESFERRLAARFGDALAFKKSAEAQPKKETDSSAADDSSNKSSSAAIKEHKINEARRFMEKKHSEWIKRDDVSWTDAKGVLDELLEYGNERGSPEFSIAHAQALLGNLFTRKLYFADLHRERDKMNATHPLEAKFNEFFHRNPKYGKAPLGLTFNIGFTAGDQPRIRRRLDTPDDSQKATVLAETVIGILQGWWRSAGSYNDQPWYERSKELLEMLGIGLDRPALKKKDLLPLGVDADVLFVDLLRNGYIDEDGKVQEKFMWISESDSSKWAVDSKNKNKYAGIKDKIYKILQEHSKYLNGSRYVLKDEDEKHKKHPQGARLKDEMIKVLQETRFLERMKSDAKLKEIYDNFADAIDGAIGAYYTTAERYPWPEGLPEGLKDDLLRRMTKDLALAKIAHWWNPADWYNAFVWFWQARKMLEVWRTEGSEAVSKNDIYKELAYIIDERVKVNGQYKQTILYVTIHQDLPGGGRKLIYKGIIVIAKMPNSKKRVERRTLRRGKNADDAGIEVLYLVDKPSKGYDEYTRDWVLDFVEVMGEVVREKLSGEKSENKYQKIVGPGLGVDLVRWFVESELARSWATQKKIDVNWFAALADLRNLERQAYSYPGLLGRSWKLSIRFVRLFTRFDFVGLFASFDDSLDNLRHVAGDIMVSGLLHEKGTSEDERQEIYKELYTGKFSAKEWNKIGKGIIGQAESFLTGAVGSKHWLSREGILRTRAGLYRKVLETGDFDLLTERLNSSLSRVWDNLPSRFSRDSADDYEYSEDEDSEYHEEEDFVDSDGASSSVDNREYSSLSSIDKFVSASSAAITEADFDADTIMKVAEEVTGRLPGKLFDENIKELFREKVVIKRAKSAKARGLKLVEEWLENQVKGWLTTQKFISEDAVKAGYNRTKYLAIKDVQKLMGLLLTTETLPVNISGQKRIFSMEKVINKIFEQIGLNYQTAIAKISKEIESINKQLEQLKDESSKEEEKATLKEQKNTLEAELAKLMAKHTVIHLSFENPDFVTGDYQRSTEKLDSDIKKALVKQVLDMVSVGWFGAFKAWYLWRVYRKYGYNALIKKLQSRGYKNIYRRMSHIVGDDMDFETIPYLTIRIGDRVIYKGIVVLLETPEALVKSKRHPLRRIMRKSLGRKNTEVIYLLHRPSEDEGKSVREWLTDFSGEIAGIVNDYLARNGEAPVSNTQQMVRDGLGEDMMDLFVKQLDDGFGKYGVAAGFGFLRYMRMVAQFIKPYIDEDGMRQLAGAVLASGFTKANGISNEDKKARYRYLYESGFEGEQFVKRVEEIRERTQKSLVADFIPRYYKYWTVSLTGTWQALANLWSEFEPSWFEAMPARQGSGKTSVAAIEEAKTPEDTSVSAQRVMANAARQAGVVAGESQQSVFGNYIESSAKLEVLIAELTKQRTELERKLNDLDRASSAAVSREKLEDKLAAVSVALAELRKEDGTGLPLLKYSQGQYEHFLRQELLSGNPDAKAEIGEIIDRGFYLAGLKEKTRVIEQRISEIKHSRERSYELNALRKTLEALKAKEEFSYLYAQGLINMLLTRPLYGDGSKKHEKATLAEYLQAEFGKIPFEGFELEFEMGTTGFSDNQRYEIMAQILERAFYHDRKTAQRMVLKIRKYGVDWFKGKYPALYRYIEHVTTPGDGFEVKVGKKGKGFGLIPFVKMDIVNKEYKRLLARKHELTQKLAYEKRQRNEDQIRGLTEQIKKVEEEIKKLPWQRINLYKAVVIAAEFSDSREYVELGQLSEGAGKWDAGLSVMYLVNRPNR